MSSIELHGDQIIAQQLRRNLAPAISAGSVAIAKEAEGRIAAYPTQPKPKHPNRYYQRGYGMRYRRADGSLVGKKTSESLGKRWSVRRRGLGAVLANSASYGPYVHRFGPGKPKQTQQHAQTGWRTDESVAREVETDGTAEELLGLAIVKVLGATNV